MDWLEMHNMEFGECIVLGSADRSILMVDCGSMNLKILEADIGVSQYIGQVLMPRYREAVSRSFLLTHFHRDHLSGFRQIIRRDPGYFDCIYLPASPVDARGRALLLEFAVYVFVFLARQNEYAQMSVAALRIFEWLHRAVGADAVYTLGRGSAFAFDGVEYDVLWPAWEDYPFPAAIADAVDGLDSLLASRGDDAEEFLALKQEFCEEYVHCCDSCSEEHRAELPEIEESIGRMADCLDRLEELSGALCALAEADEIVELLNDPAVRGAYSHAQNMASVVFHNRRVRQTSCDDILMTGDATPETFDQIQDDLYDAYYICKAPHHGTASGWSDVFSEIAKAHILISNGSYHASGTVCANYTQDEGVKHCTNCYACEWFAENGACCNQTVCCWEYEARGASPMCCPMCNGETPTAACGIYVLSCEDERGCLCDPR